MLTRKNIGKWQKVAAEQNIDLKEGVYMGFSGPTYETPAEIECHGRGGCSWHVNCFGGHCSCA